MAFLTVAGTTIPVAAGSMTADIETIGTRSRTFDGTMREEVRNRVTGWRGQSRVAESSAARAYRDLLNASTQPQTVGGTMLSSSGATVSMFTRASRERPMVGSTGTLWVVDFELDESS